MRIVYLSEAQIPSRSTNSMQVLRMCDAFGRLGHEVTLVHPRAAAQVPEGFTGDVADFYGIDHAFERVPIGPTWLPQRPRWLQRGVRGLAVARCLTRLRKSGAPFACYARSLLGAGVALRVRGGECSAVVAELHDEPPSAARQSLRRLDAIVTISDALRRDVVQLVGDPNRVVVEHDGVDLSRVSRLTREAARNQLGLTDVAGPLVVYTGRAIAGKGVDVLLEAAPRIAELAGAVVIVGRVYEPEYLQHASDAVRFVGFVPPAAVADYLAAADVLVLPTTPSLPYAEYTSPLKLFEYMAAERPIVASDLPVLREVLRDGENALLYPPDDATALASAVERAWSDASLAQRLAAKALEDVDTYSWDSRAKRIVDLLERVAR